MTKPLISIVAATRPNFMKVAPLLKKLEAHQSRVSTHLIHTGQHYDNLMNDTFFSQLDIQAPFKNFEIGSGSHAFQTSKTMMAFEKYLLEYSPQLVIVVGDVNATLACAIAASKCKIKVAHVESGLRSFDRKMPEEINRLLTDTISDYLYTPTIQAGEQLLSEGVSKEKIVFVGNIMIDTLYAFKDRAMQLNYATQLGINCDYSVLTLHRPSTVDNKKMFNLVLTALSEISNKMTIVFPAHPRTKDRIISFGLESFFNFGSVEPNKINIIDPLGYLEMLSLVVSSSAVLTDSGGLQEETTSLGIPCLTLRENTERPITVEQGSNMIVGRDPKRILDGFEKIMMQDLDYSKPDRWDGNTAERIIEHILTII